MANILVRDLPDDIHAALVRRADANGQSLQQFLSAELSRVAVQPTLDEVLARIGRRRSGRLSLDQATADLREDRDRR